MTTPDWRIEAPTVVALLADAVARHPERPYCTSPDIALTYAGFAQVVAGLAAHLRPVAEGRVVALVLPNSAAYLAAYFGALCAGATPALVNPAHPDATVVKLLGELDVGAVLSDREIAGLEVTPLTDARLPHYGEGNGRGDGADLSPASLGPADPAAILFTGGTTGLPKQIAQPHDALIKSAERMEWGWPTTDGEVWLPVAPFTHIYGFLMGVLSPLVRAGKTVIPPRFQPDVIVELLAAERVTIFGGGPPAIYQAIMSAEAFGATEFPALRVCPGGGAPFPLAVQERWRAATGISIAEGYGMTEIAPICVNSVRHGITPGSAGHPAPGTTVEIVDIATGEVVLPTGETGEVRVKGPHLMAGYSGDPEETAQVLRNGFLYTGDIGCLDANGVLTLSDRKKNVIFVKGFNVFPREVEETLLAHTAVSGACVVGRQDARAGEVPVAYVTLRTELDPAELAAHCGETLAAYKRPAEIVVLEALPVTPAAKVDRTALQAHANAKGAIQ